MTFILRLLLLISLTVLPATAAAQRIINEYGNSIDSTQNVFGQGDSIDSKSVPHGIYVWTVDSRFGDRQSVQMDTVPHLFPNTNMTAGIRQQYNYLGNLGSPRISRLFTDNRYTMTRDPFIFTQPLSYFFRPIESYLFTNTLSPFTNITYHSRGDRTTGEDRFKVLFATNVNKRLGFGFKIDYLYGRGYYASQSTSLIDGSLYGSYIDDAYSAHFFIKSDYTKMAENGGLEDDAYITSPQSFSDNYATNDYPTRLSSTWNRINASSLFLTHRYNLGIRRTVRADGSVVKEVRIKVSPQLVSLDSLNSLPTAPIDTALLAKERGVKAEGDSAVFKQFIPVTSFIHTLHAERNQRKYTQNALPDNYYTHEYYGTTQAATNDKIRFSNISNTLAIEVHEGFNKWVKSGMKLYARHDYRHYEMPADTATFTPYTENLFTLGAQLYKRQGTLFHYDVLGEIATTGSSWGIFNIEGKADLNIPLLKDTLQLQVNARIANEEPSFFYRHLHSRFAWWDNSLKQQLTTSIGGTLRYHLSSVSLNVQSLQNYTYLSEEATGYTTTSNTTAYTTAVAVRQASANIQVIGLTARQNFSLGPLHGETALTYQTTSDKEALPLPMLNAYANLFLKFRIAKVLGVEFGADGTYFTSYYAPTYSPFVAQFVTQATETRVKTGNYPVINAYANFHLPKCRFYISATHINYSSSGGRYFLVPHHPINPQGIHFGISWSFLN